jgi:hypothetical protein
MKTAYAILFTLLFPLLAAAQQGGVSPYDATRIDKIWKVFLDGVSRHDTAMLRSISLESVSCAPCSTDTGKNYFVPAAAFFSRAIAWPGKPIWQAITTKKYWVNTIVTSNKPQNVMSAQKHFVIFELSFVTTEPNTLAPGHEGQSHLFQFIDLNGTLKFYGLATVP